MRPVLEGICTAASVLAASVIAIAGLWTASMAAYKQGLKESLVRAAEGAAALVDPELHARIRSPDQIDSPEYLKAVAPLRAMQERISGVQYIYTFVEDGNGIRFILDAAAAGDRDNDGIEDRSGVWELYEEPDPAMQIVLDSPNGHPLSAATETPYSDKWGTFVSGFAPILDRSGRSVGGVGVDMNAREYIKQLAIMRRSAIYGLLPAIGASVCVGLMVWDQRRRVMYAHAALQQQTSELTNKTDALQRQAIELGAERERAESAGRAKGAFVANMTHELRTPLTAILGYAELLERDRSLDTEALQWVGTVRRSGEHLLSLVNDVLDYSKVEAGKMKLESIDFDPSTLLEDVRLLMSEPASAKNIGLEYAWTSEAPAVIRTDPTRLRQILFNLVGNAIKFTASGTVRLIASMEPGGKSGHRLIVRVQDSGIGMAEDVVQRLFRPFTQADASMSRRFGGTGLGLSISRELARLLGGDISVESRAGFGSTFTLTIEAGPIERVGRTSPPDATLARLVTTSTSQSVIGALAGIRLLLVEDGVDNQRLATHHLSRAGAIVTVVDNGKLAIEAVEREAFDLVLMDMQMPIMDGYEATRELRARGYTIPILALTAHATTADSNLCLSSGCDDFVAKPFTRQSLIDACINWTGRDGRSAQDGAAAPRAA